MIYERAKFPEKLYEFSSDITPSNDGCWVYSDSGNPFSSFPSYIRERQFDTDDHLSVDRYDLLLQISPTRAFYSSKSISCICMAYPYDGQWFLDSSFFDIDSAYETVTFSSKKPKVVSEERIYKNGDETMRAPFFKLGNGIMVYFEVDGDTINITTGFDSNEDFIEWKLKL